MNKAVRQLNPKLPALNSTKQVYLTTSHTPSKKKIGNTAIEESLTNLEKASVGLKGSREALEAIKTYSEVIITLHVRSSNQGFNAENDQGNQENHFVGLYVKKMGGREIEVTYIDSMVGKINPDIKDAIQEILEKGTVIINTSVQL